jgi:hypothetical protein
MIDDQSDGGSWRREMLAGPMTVSQLRDMVSELEHSLSVSRRNFDALRQQNTELVKRLAEAVAKEMEHRAKVVRMERELSEWNSRKTG